MTSGPRLAVFGDVVLDVVVMRREKTAPDSDARARIVPTGGGSAANTAVWASRAGSKAAFFGQAGDDLAGRQLKAELAAAGVAVDPPLGNFLLTPAEATGIIVINVEGSSRTMVTDRGANLTVPPGVVRAEGLERADWFHFTGYSLFESAPRTAALEALALCREYGLPFSVDPSSYSLLREHGTEAFLEDVAGAAVLLPNAAEARELTGAADPEKAALDLGERFPVVALKLGREGCLVAFGPGRRVLRVPPEPVQDPPGPIDPTGAGDAFAAGFLTALAGHWTGLAPNKALVLGAARKGNGWAARAVTVAGGRGQRVGRPETSGRWARA